MTSLQTLDNIYNLKPVNIGGKSQKNQDFYIDYVFKCVEPINKFFVEFGAVDGFQMSNTFWLRRKHKWTGLLLDGFYENSIINLHKKFITKDNIVSIFEEFNVPEEFDFLSVDLDGMDFYVLESILKKYKPTLIQVETNLRFEPNQSVVIKYDENWIWDYRSWYGASPLAYKKMTANYGYVPLIMHHDDLFLINEKYASDLIKNKPWLEIQPRSNKQIYNTHVGSVGFPKFYFDKNNFTEY